LESEQKVGTAHYFSRRRVLRKAVCNPTFPPPSPQAFVVMMEAMIPGLMYLRSQSPDLVNEKVVAEIFAALSPKA